MGSLRDSTTHLNKLWHSAVSSNAEYQLSANFGKIRAIYSLVLGGIINRLYAVMTIFAQWLNICSSKFEREYGAFHPPGYAPGNSDWWLCGFVFILLLQMQTRRQPTPVTKRQIWRG